MFFILFGCWGRAIFHPLQGQTGLVHNLLVRFFSRFNSKIIVLETSFYDFVIIENDHLR